jgi:hypothetical protein
MAFWMLYDDGQFLDEERPEVICECCVRSAIVIIAPAIGQLFHICIIFLASIKLRGNENIG